MARKVNSRKKKIGHGKVGSLLKKGINELVKGGPQRGSRNKGGIGQSIKPFAAGAIKKIAGKISNSKKPFANKLGKIVGKATNYIS